MAFNRANVAALIPAYGEGRQIGDVVRRTRTQLDQVLVVDDGSLDETAAAARNAGAEVIRHPTNLGKGAAIKTGLQELGCRANTESILLLDGDGQHRPEEIPRFLDEANRSSAALIVGNRMADLRPMPWIRRVTNRFMSRQLSGICGREIPDSQCGFRMLRRDLAAVLCHCPASRFDFESEMLVIATRHGWPIASVPVTTIYGDEKSTIHPLRDTVRFFTLMSRLRRESRAAV